MQVYCSNCNTAHSITHEEMKRLKEPVINCSGCEKKIKMQFCPECGAFYSITFSNIQPGNYRYRCKKCSSGFMITIPAAVTSPVPVVKPQQTFMPSPAAPKPAEKSADTKTAAQPVKSPAPEAKSEITFMQNSINTFTVGELFSITGTSFSMKKLIPSAAAALFMLLLVRIFTSVQGMIPVSFFSGSATASVLFNLLPATILFSFYTVAAAMVSKVTLERIFYNREPDWDSIVKFALKKCPAILACNVTAILLINLMLVLFGKIPLMGPLLFSLVFLPVYLLSVIAVMIFMAGLWFYPPIAAHRESGMFMNLRDLFVFIKKHNLALLYMIPVAAMLTAVTFAAIFAIHSIALTLTVTLSKAVLSGDASAIFSGIPALFIKISESSLSGINSSIFRQLAGDLTAAHYMGGFIIGTCMAVISILLMSLFFSVTATVSTHIYIMMERGLTVDDKRKALTLFILFMFLAVFILARKIL